MQAFLRREFHIDTHTVGQISGLLNNFRRRARDSLGMDIAPEMVFCTQKVQSLIDQFHGMGRVFDDSGTQKQSFNIISFVKFHGDTAELLRGKGGAHLIVGAAVQTVFTVIDALIREQDFQKRNTPSVCGKAVTDTCSTGVPQTAFFPSPVRTTGSTGNIIFGSI